MTDLWDIVRTEPELAAGLLAVHAVEQLGPPAREHVTWLTERYAGTSPNKIAELVLLEALKRARGRGALASLAGPVSAFTTLGTFTGLAPVSGTAQASGSEASAGPSGLGTVQAQLVLEVAAAYGLDPLDEQRAVDLLTLFRVYPDAESAAGAASAARAALRSGPARPTGPMGSSDASSVVQTVGRTVGRLWPLLAPDAARITAARAASHLVPRMLGAGAVGRVVTGTFAAAVASAAVGAVADGYGTRRLGERAIRFYRTQR